MKASNDMLQRATTGTGRFSVDPWMVAIWASTLAVTLALFNFVHDARTYYEGGAVEDILAGRFEEIDGRTHARLRALNLAATLSTVAAMRDDGGMDDWTLIRATAADRGGIRHGDRILSVPDIEKAMGAVFPRDPDKKIGMPDMTLEAPLPLIPISEEGRARMGRIIVSTPIGNPHDCREAMSTIAGYRSIVANFEVSDLQERDGKLNEIWLPLDPNRSKALDRLCLTQFVDGSRENAFKGKGQILKFRLLPFAERSPMDVLPHIPLPN